jgi:hypothetical protein
MSSYDRIAELPLEIESLELEGLELRFSEEFTRLTTPVKLRGPGRSAPATGIGEDVVYDGLDHVALQTEGASLDLAGSYTLDSFSRHLEEVELWPSPPVRDVSALYRRWAFESAALDLALQQAGRSLADVLERGPRPVRFVVSMRLEREIVVEGLRSPTVRCGCSTVTRGRTSSSTRRTAGPRSSSKPWPRQVPSRRSTSRVYIRALRWTWRPTRSSTGW